MPLRQAKKGAKAPFFALFGNSEHAAGGKSLDGTNADDVAKAGGAEQCGMTHATKEGTVGQLGTFVGVLDGCLADGNGDDIAHNHHQGHFRGPAEGGGSDGQERGEHANPEETLYLQGLGSTLLILVRVIHPVQRLWSDQVAVKALPPPVHCSV